MGVSTAAMKVLVVDDERPICGLLSDFLTIKGFDVAQAGNGQECLNQVQKRLPDVILLDVNMPVMDGFEVCRRIKADPATKHVHVVFITAQPRPEDKEKGRALGCLDYMTKPVDLFKLAEFLKTLAERGRAGSA